jgi:predicted MFS family arabinose efflux permease
MGKIIFFLLPNRAEKSLYLSKLQRAVALARARRGLHPEPPETIDKSAVKPAFYDVRIYIYALLYMCILMANLALVYFIPGIIKQIGFVEMPGNALMLVPPLASSFVGMVLVAWCSDRMKDRGRWVSLLCFTAALGYLLLLTVRLAGFRYFAVFLIAWGS